MPSIITIGTATKDIFLQSPLFRVVKDPHFTARAGFPTGEAECFALGSKVEIDTITFTTGGGASNAAVTFARQGIKTACLAKIGNDQAGKDIIKELKRERITPLTIKDRDLPTAYSTLLLAPSGERTVLVYRGASEDLRERDLPMNRLRAAWAYVVPGGIEYRTTKKIIDHLYRNGSLIAFSPSSAYLKMGMDKLKPLLNKMKVVVLNREEASLLTKVHYDDERGIFKKLDALIGGIAVMTEGHKGVLVSDGKHIFKAGIFQERRITDRTGAGDAFGSGFVAALIKRSNHSTSLDSARDKSLGASPSVSLRASPSVSLGASFEKDDIIEAIRLASANATSVVEYIGAKEGILTARDFKHRRWWELDVHIAKV